MEAVLIVAFVAALVLSSLVAAVVWIVKKKKRRRKPSNTTQTVTQTVAQSDDDDSGVLPVDDLPEDDPNVEPNDVTTATTTVTTTSTTVTTTKPKTATKTADKPKKTNKVTKKPTDKPKKTTQKPKTTTKPRAPDSSNGSLPPPDIKAKNKAPWYITWADGAAQLADDSLYVHLYKGKWGGGTGLQFRANPLKKFPTTEATLSYQVYIPSDYPWTISGKLAPGFCFGTGAAGSGCPSGGKYEQNAGSVRISWHVLKKTSGGVAVAYVYLPGQSPMGMQGSTFQAEAEATTDKGIHVFGDALRLKAGDFNDISLTVKMNTPGQRDGVLRLTVNGVTKAANDMMWRTSGDIRLTGVLCSVFFGGGQSKYAPDRDTYLRYQNFRIQ